MNFNNLKELKISGKNVKELAINGKMIWTKEIPVPNAFIMKSINGVDCKFDATDPQINRNLAYVDLYGNVLEPYKSNPELAIFDSVVEIDDEKGEISSVGVYAFYDCSNLSSVNLPNATLINDSAFSNCSNLSSVDLPNATSIGRLAFCYCSNLSSVDLSAATSIGKKAFYGCWNLSSVNLPNATSINGQAFQYCSNLLSVNLSSATSINSQAFQYCSNLSSIDLPAAVGIDGSAFARCSNLSSVNLPVAARIGWYAFAGCSNLLSVDLSAAAWIDEDVFADCSNLSTIDFGNELTAVPTLENVNAFQGLPSDYVIKVPDALYDQWIMTAPWSESDISSHIKPQTDRTIFVLKSTSGTNCRFDATDPQINRNLVYTNYSRNVLEPYKSNPELRDFDSVAEINDENGEISSVGEAAFYKCSNLSSIDLPATTSIGEYAFGYCSKLSSVDLPVAKSIYGTAFQYCSNLASVNLPTATLIDTAAFRRCSNLSSVNLPVATSFGSNIFDSCSNLLSVNLPATTSIGEYAFDGCSKLSMIDFGNDLTAVPALANANTFDSLYSDYVIKVPTALYEDWIQTPPWSDASIRLHIHPQTENMFVLKSD